MIKNPNEYNYVVFNAAGTGQYLTSTRKEAREKADEIGGTWAKAADRRQVKRGKTAPASGREVPADKPLVRGKFRVKKTARKKSSIWGASSLVQNPNEYNYVVFNASGRAVKYCITRQEARQAAEVIDGTYSKPARRKVAQYGTTPSARAVPEGTNIMRDKFVAASKRKRKKVKAGALAAVAEAPVARKRTKRPGAARVRAAAPAGFEAHMTGVYASARRRSDASGEPIMMNPAPRSSRTGRFLAVRKNPKASAPSGAQFGIEVGSHVVMAKFFPGAPRAVGVVEDYQYNKGHHLFDVTLSDGRRVVADAHQVSPINYAEYLRGDARAVDSTLHFEGHRLSSHRSASPAAPGRTAARAAARSDRAATRASASRPAAPALSDRAELRSFYAAQAAVRAEQHRANDPVARHHAGLAAQDAADRKRAASAAKLGISYAKKNPAKRKAKKTVRRAR